MDNVSYLHDEETLLINAFDKFYLSSLQHPPLWPSSDEFSMKTGFNDDDVR